MAAGFCVNYRTVLAVAMEAHLNARRNGTDDDKQQLVLLIT